MVCNVCSTASVENEIHFLLECSAYSREREDFFLKSNKLYDKNYFNSNFKSQNVFQLYYLFNSKKVTVLKIFVKYIRSITDIRSRLM